MRDTSLKAKLAKISNDSYHGGLIATSIASFYDGVMLYAEALNRTLAKAPYRSNELSRGKRIVKEITSGTFYSALLINEQQGSLRNDSIPY